MNGSETVRPETLAEAREALIRPGTLLIRGTGTAQSWGGVVDSADTVVDTTGLDRLIVHNPADMTVAVGAGMPMATLQDLLAEHGQRVSLDAERIASGATVGGLLATNDSGPLRQTYGSLRDLVLGATVVLTDGRVARSGGHVVKNVAGYDLAKLVAGSLGALGLVAEVVLRLHPRPETVRTLTMPSTPGEAFTVATELLRSPLEPVALEWRAGRLSVRFEGTAEGVDTRVRKALSFSSALTEASDPEAAPGPGETVFRAGLLPSDWPGLSERLDELASAHSVRAEQSALPGVGVSTVYLSGGAPEHHAAVLTGVREYVGSSGGSVLVHRRVDESVPSWGPAPGYARILTGLKRELDPDGKLAPGRFEGYFA